MERVKLTLEVEPELRRRIKLSATARDESLREWVHRALLRELEEDSGVAGHELLEGRLTLPPTGAKPKGSDNPPKPRGGGNPVSEAVIEDRR
jgi:hypothetical protein